MEGAPHADPAFASNSNSHDPETVTQITGMFTSPQNFIVNGGTFTNITDNHPAAPSVPSDFRTITLGDIDLQHELGSNLGTVNRRPRFRRVYAAKVEGRQAKLAVSIYEGDDAEEQWQQCVVNHRSARHPNILQIYGIASSWGVHAILFHGNLIPFKKFVDVHRDSHFSVVSIFAQGRGDFNAACDYLRSALRRPQSSFEFTFWIRHGIGCNQVSIEFTPQHDFPLVSLGSDVFEKIPIIQKPFLDAPDPEATVIDSLTLEEYHHICYRNLGCPREISFATPIDVQLGSIVFFPVNNQVEDFYQLASLPYVTFHSGPWVASSGATGSETEGWTRFHSGDVFNSHFTMDADMLEKNSKSWLSQANLFFSFLRITSNFEDYVFVYHLHFKIAIPAPTKAPPAGFLFICPEKDVDVAISGFRLPDCPAFWSLDPLGVDRLSVDQATDLGFPTIRCLTTFGGRSLDAGVYAGLRRFHKAKGFNPDSYEVTQHLREPRFRLSPEVHERFNIPFLTALFEDRFPQTSDENSNGDEDDSHGICTDADGEEDIWDGLYTDEKSEYPQTSADWDNHSDTPDNDWNGVHPQSPAGLAVLPEVYPRGHLDLVDDEYEPQDNVHGSFVTDNESELSGPLDEIPVSQTFKFIARVRLLLIVFLVSYWLYKQL